MHYPGKLGVVASPMSGHRTFWRLYHADVVVTRKHVMQFEVEVCCMVDPGFSAHLLVLWATTFDAS